MIRPLLLTSVLVAPTTVQQPSSPPMGEQSREFYNSRRSYRIQLPSTWRRLTPDEALELRPQLPPDLLDLPIPGHFYRLGEVERWLKSGFDGVCLSVTETDGEPAMDEATLDRVREHTTQTAPGGLRLTIKDLRIDHVGTDKHPVVRAEVEIWDESDRLLARRMDYLVPTGGESLRFSFRSPPDRFTAEARRFQSIMDGITCAKPAEGPRELSDMLQTALFVGGLVGLALVLLYKGRRT